MLWDVSGGKLSSFSGELAGTVGGVPAVLATAVRGSPNTRSGTSWTMRREGVATLNKVHLPNDPLQYTKWSFSDPQKANVLAKLPSPSPSSRAIGFIKAFPIKYSKDQEAHGPKIFGFSCFFKKTLCVVRGKGYFPSLVSKY